MKLLYCLECHSVVRLFEQPRACECGQTGGQYIDNSKAEIYGDGVPFGIMNDEFDHAITNRTDDWPGIWFRGFVIPENSDNLVRVDGPGA